jgi:hypothetical protein
MKRCIILVVIFSLLLITACGKETAENSLPANSEAAVSNESGETSVSAINDSAFDDLGKTLGELIGKYGKVTDIIEIYPLQPSIQAATLKFSNSQVRYWFTFDNRPDLFSTTFTEDELKLETTYLYATVADIFPTVQSTITDKELSALCGSEFKSNEGAGRGLGEYDTSGEYKNYAIYIMGTTELGIIERTNTIQISFND